MTFEGNKKEFNFFYHHFYINQINYVNIIIKRESIKTRCRFLYQSKINEKGSTYTFFPHLAQWNSI